jgi:hypothetical protein
MDTVAYSELLVNFGKNLMRIAEGAEAAADDDIEGAEWAEAVARARSKLAEHEATIKILLADSKPLADQFAKKFAQSLELICESLERIDSK